MWYGNSSNKKIAFNVIFIFGLIISILFFSLNFSNVAYANNSNNNGENLEGQLSDHIDDILKDIDTNELDDYFPDDYNLDIFSGLSFKDFSKKILSGYYFDDFGNLFSNIIEIIKENLKPLLSLFLLLLSIIVLYQIFYNFSTEKHDDLRKSIKIIFSFLIALILLYLFKDISKSISSSINKIFNFSKILFPILLNLLLLSGSKTSFGMYSTLSVFLLNTGSYIFVYILIPISLSIFILSIFGSALNNDKFSKFIDLFKSIFKYIIISFFAVFGLFSAVNVVSSGMRDGVSLKLTKFAIKNYIPILGGYISDGFNFVHSCSLLIKNSFGICGIIILFFNLIKPLIMYFVYLLFFKILSIVTLFVGNSQYSNMFNNVSKCMSYFICCLVGVFLIFFIFVYLLIISVSVI